MTSNLSFLSDNAAYLPHPRLVDERLREMFEAARSEAENFGVLAAVVSCTLNDMNDAGASLVPNFVLGFIPSDPILLQNLRRLAGGCIPAGLDTHIEFLNAQIEVAKKLLRGSVEERKSFLTLHEIDQLAHAWRGVCDHVIVVMAGLDALLPEVGGGSSQIDRFQLENGLVNARDGGSDLSLKRDFNFPSWAQKRRHRRVLLNDIGKAKVKGRTRTVLITDASAGGSAWISPKASSRANGSRSFCRRGGCSWVKSCGRRGRARACSSIRNFRKTTSCFHGSHVEAWESC